MTHPAHASGTYALGDRSIYRMGYGAMQLVGHWIWDVPSDPDNATRVLRRAVELGVNFFDTADSYGPEVSENQLREALWPYDGLLVATKCGFLRPSQKEWVVCGYPPYLRQQVELSLRRLRVEQLDLLQLHRVDSAYPLADQVGVLNELRLEGKIAQLGLSEVTVEQLEEARTIAPIVSVQNYYNVGNREWDGLLAHCEAEGIAFIPWCPLDSSDLLGKTGVLNDVAERMGATRAQVALAWLLAKSPAMVPIPGTSKVAHLEENVGASDLVLSAEDFAALDEWATSEQTD